MSIDELLNIMAMLRDSEHGCPWDRKQTFQTIAPHTLEEVYEVIDTIEREDYGHLANELGDLLFQIVFYAQLGKEKGYFEFSDIVSEISNKLLSRHPHVFPDATPESFGTEKTLTPDQVEGKWEQIKKQEREEKHGTSTSILDDIPKSFPALTRAGKIQKRAANAGFDWPDNAGVVDKVHEEFAELTEAMEQQSSEKVQEELGDIFFSLVNLSRHLRIDPETCLRKANAKFESRFRIMERNAAEAGVSLGNLSLEELEAFWQAAKGESSQ